MGYELSYKSISLAWEQIDLEGWSDPKEERPEPETGSRLKVTLEKLVYCASQERYTTVGRYILKYPKKRREHQIWSELLASYIAGDLLEWNVQHVSLAKNEKGEWGNLLSYFYEESKESFTEGGQLFVGIDKKYDHDKGTRHTLSLLKETCEKGQNFRDNKELQDEFYRFWARAFALDCLISNTDRHAENWGVIDRGNEDFRMAPLFDNGTSLDCGRNLIRKNKVFDSNGKIRPEHLQKMYEEGRHHVRAEGPCEKGTFYVPVCRKFLDSVCPKNLRSEALAFFEQARALDLGPVKTLMAAIQKELNPHLPEEYKLSDQRIEYTLEMLKCGIRRLDDILEQSKSF